MKKFINWIIFLFFLSVVLAGDAPRQVSARECLPDQFCYWSCEDICQKFPWKEICPCFRPSPTPTEVIPTPTEIVPTPTEVMPTPTEAVPTESGPTLTPVPEGNGGNGGPSEPGPAGPPHCGVTVPSPPILLRVSSAADDKQGLEWTAVELATHYSVHYGRSSGTYEYGVPDVGKATSFTVGGLAAGVNYCFAVRAVNDCAPSELSNEICMGAGQILGARTTVLGATSSREPIEWMMPIFGYLFLFSGLWLKRKKLAGNFWKSV